MKWQKPKHLTVALWKLYFNNLGVYHEWILCSIWCWMEETNWVCVKLSYVTSWHFCTHHVVVTTAV